MPREIGFQRMRAEGNGNYVVIPSPPERLEWRAEGQELR